MDHRIPQQLGGESTVENLVACCSLCGTLKGGLRMDDLDDMRKNIARRNAESGLNTGNVTSSRFVRQNEALPMEPFAAHTAVKQTASHSAVSRSFPYLL